MKTIRCVDELEAICARVSEEFQRKRRVLSFAEYLDLFATEPGPNGRDATAYAQRHYRKRPAERPDGTS